MKTPIIVLIAAAIVIGGYAFYKNPKTVTTGMPENADQNGQLLGASSTNSEVGGTNGADGIAQTPAQKKMAFDAFLRRGDGSYVCTVKQAMSDMENSGTVYIEGSADEGKRKIRGEFTTVAEGRTIGTTFVIKDGFNYMWTSAAPKNGFKVAMPKEALDAEGKVTVNADGSSGTYAWSATQIGEYDCQPWTVDQAKFALPAGVTFTEMKK